MGSLYPICYCVVFKFLTVYERVTAAKICWITEAAALNQPVALKTILTSKWKPNDVLL